MRAQQSQEATYKLCRVKTLATGPNGHPYLTTHDGRTIRFPDPLIKPCDTVKVDLAKNEIVDFAKFEVRTSALLAIRSLLLPVCCCVSSFLVYSSVLGRCQASVKKCVVSKPLRVVTCVHSQVGNVCAITAGHNIGRVGTIVSTVSSR